VGKPGFVSAPGEAEQIGGGHPGPAVVDGVDLEGADSHGRRLYGARRVVQFPGRRAAASLDIPVTADRWLDANVGPRNLGVVRLLVVDDDVSVGKLLRAIFDGEGWEVVNATSGEECLTMVQDAPPDVIVLDNMMPGMTGLETARRLRQDGFDKPIVLFSAYVGPELQSAAQELDLDPVPKVDTQAVIRIVESLGGALT